MGLGERPPRLETRILIDGGKFDFEVGQGWLGRRHCGQRGRGRQRQQDERAHDQPRAVSEIDWAGPPQRNIDAP